MRPSRPATQQDDDDGSPDEGRVSVHAEDGTTEAVPDSGVANGRSRERRRAASSRQENEMGAEDRGRGWAEGGVWGELDQHRSDSSATCRGAVVPHRRHAGRVPAPGSSAPPQRTQTNTIHAGVKQRQVPKESDRTQVEAKEVRFSDMPAVTLDDTNVNTVSFHHANCIIFIQVSGGICISEIFVSVMVEVHRVLLDLFSNDTDTHMNCKELTL